MFRRVVSLLLATLLPLSQFAAVETCHGGSACAIQDSRPHIHVSGGCHHCHAHRSAKAADAPAVAQSAAQRVLPAEGTAYRTSAHPDEDVIYVAAEGLFAVRRQADRVPHVTVGVGEFRILSRIGETDAGRRAAGTHAPGPNDFPGPVPLYLRHCAFLI